MVAVVQLVGFALAYVSAVIAYFGLPPDSIGGRNGVREHLLGVIGAVVCAVALPAGLWEAFRRTRLPVVAALATSIGLVVLVGWTAWGLQLGWSVSL